MLEVELGPWTSVFPKEADYPRLTPSGSHEHVVETGQNYFTACSVFTIGYGI